MLVQQTQRLRTAWFAFQMFNHPKLLISKENGQEEHCPLEARFHARRWQGIRKGANLFVPSVSKSVDRLKTWGPHGHHRLAAGIFDRTQEMVSVGTWLAYCRMSSSWLSLTHLLAPEIGLGFGFCSKLGWNQITFGPNPPPPPPENHPPG